MSIHFSRSLRRLEADSFRRNLLVLSVTILILGAWAAWLVRSRVAVYAPTISARLEVDREGHAVAAPVGGRVVALSLTRGSRVKAGDVLLSLDSRAEFLARSEAQAKLAPSSRQVGSLQDELRAAEEALELEARSAIAARSESDARIKDAARAADLAGEEARRLTELRRHGLVSELDALRAEKLVEERQGEVASLGFAANRLERDLEARRQDRVARIARLRNEVAAIEGTQSEAAATASRMDYEIAQREIRAPISGTLAEVSPLTVGAVIQSGDRLGTIVPDGALKVVGLFEPSVAIGRVRAGQPARVRLEGFPWTQYGTAGARVSLVAGEVHDGRVRVELDLVSTANADIPLQHGLPAEVDVEVERISPLAMVLRAAGARLSASAAQPATITRR
jgi:membrane fusion protein (multidrug efflux system)